MERPRDNLAPADVYLGIGQTILPERERIKRNHLERRGQDSMLDGAEAGAGDRIH